MSGSPCLSHQSWIRRSSFRPLIRQSARIHGHSNWFTRKNSLCCAAESVSAPEISLPNSFCAFGTLSITCPNIRLASQRRRVMLRPRTKRMRYDKVGCMPTAPRSRSPPRRGPKNRFLKTIKSSMTDAIRETAAPTLPMCHDAALGHTVDADAR